MNRSDITKDSAKENFQAAKATFKDEASKRSSQIEDRLGDVKSAAKDLKEDAESSLMESIDGLAEKFGANADDVSRLAKEYSDTVVDFVRKHPVQVACGVAGVGILVGAYLARKK